MTRLRKTVAAAVLTVMLLVCMPQREAKALPIIAEVIREGIVWVLKAVNLMVQRLQNETLWLQNAAKVVENKLSALKLNEIARWTQRQKDLYEKYYDDLWRIRSTIESYHKIATVVRRQQQIVEQYQFTWSMISQDGHFTSSELEYMARVYSGIINESARNLERIILVVNSYRLQMSDAKRLEVINKAAEDVEKNYRDMQQFSSQNIQMSIYRAKDKNEMEAIKKLYGIN